MPPEERTKDFADAVIELVAELLAWYERSATIRTMMPLRVRAALRRVEEYTRALERAQ